MTQCSSESYVRYAYLHDQQERSFFLLTRRVVGRSDLEFLLGPSSLFLADASFEVIPPTSDKTHSIHSQRKTLNVIDAHCLLFDLKASRMASPRSAWSGKFPVYQIDFAAIASGKRVASTKRRIRWCEIVTSSCFYLSAINYCRL
jgi:hypothetical protein